MTKLISLATMREIERVEASIGQIVRYTGDMANPSGMGAVVAVEDSPYSPFTVALTDGREWRTDLTGSRWQVSRELVNPEQLEVLKAGAAAKKALDETGKRAAAEEFARMVAKVTADNPHLISGGARSHVQAAKNIRIELKRAFPAVKFSVTSKSYSGGNSINIDWTDGPNSAQVEAVTKKYQGGSFDGMTDCYNYSHSPWTEVFGDAKYVFCSRHYSDKLIASAIRRVCNRLGGMDSTPAVEDYRQGRLYAFPQSGGCDVEREINVALSRHTYCIERSPT